jgi:hypothetical protein
MLIAANSYECRVLDLVQGKRHLFDNVVDQDATEDVVGISRKLVEVLAEDLAGRPGAPDAAAEARPEPAAEQVPDETGSGQTESEDTQVERAEGIPLPEKSETGEMEEAVRHAIEAAQKAFGRRIERILGAGGGLLVVLDHVDAESDRLAAAISDRVPVALIDPRTLGGLRRLGDASPVAHARTLVESAEVEIAPTEPRLLSQAREKLQGAEVLIRQACPGPAMDLLLGALLGCAAVRAKQETSPIPQQTGIWLYSEALPKGILTPDEAGLVMRALAFAQGAETIPEALLRGLAEDVARFVSETSETWAIGVPD